MNPIFQNCLLLFVMVIVLSLFQTRWRVFLESPGFFLVTVFIMPFLIAGKATKGGRSIDWVDLTTIEVFIFSMMIAFYAAKSIAPKINEGYIYAYTLFHWYLLSDTIGLTGLNFWTCLVSIISIYPTYLILRTAFEYRVLDRRTKTIVYYWFVFTIMFTYFDQVVMDIIDPVLQLTEVNLDNGAKIFFSAVQLYFISAMMGLAFVGLPFIHMDRSAESFSERWKDAKKEAAVIRKYKLDNYIDYQITGIQVIYITLLSAGLFWIDATSQFRAYLIFIYTVVLPVVFFYFKWTPERNMDEKT